MNCGSSMDASSNFCNSCGERQPQVTRHSTSELNDDQQKLHADLGIKNTEPKNGPSDLKLNVKSKIKLVFEWFSNKWAPFKSKIVNSKAGVKYPRIAKFVSNGWVITALFFILCSSPPDNKAARELREEQAEWRAMTESPGCRKTVNFAKNVCEPRKSMPPPHYAQCLEGFIKQGGGCPGNYPE